MVKAVVGDETQLNLAENRLSQSPLTSQVGLVIGKLSSALDRGFVYDLIPTPRNDAGEPACSLVENAAVSRGGDKKRASKSKALDSSTLAIDADWVAEHARQVSRMLVGGVKVVGIYVWVSDSIFKNSTITLCQTVKGVAEAAPISENDWDERLLIHICYSPMRWTCRTCILSSNITSSSIRPCDFKMGRVLSSLQKFSCTYDFELRLPILRETASHSSTMSEILRNGILNHAKEIRGAKAVIDGNLVLNEEACTTDGLHKVELLLPFMKNTFAEACRQKDVYGVLVFRGSVCSFAYSNTKELLSQAVADIKDDIIRSLQSRLDIICDEADDDVGTVNDDNVVTTQDEVPEKPVSKLVLHSLRKTCCLSFPRRVFVPWLAGTYICDYIQPFETLEVLRDHCVELMSIEAPIDPSTILELESEAPSLTTESFWDIIVPGHSASSASVDNSGEIHASAESSGKSTKSLSFNMSVVAASILLLISILVGFVLDR